MPVPRREDAVVHRAREPRHVPLLRLRRARRRDRVPAEDRGHRVRRGRRAARRPGGHPAHLRGRRHGPPARPGHQDPPAGGQQAGRGVLRRAAAHPGGRARDGVPHLPRVRRGGGAALRLRLRPRGLGRAHQAPARRGLLLRRAGEGRALAAGQPRADGPLPPPPAVADPRPRRRGRRLRGAAPLRRRPHRGQVPQHVRDARLPQDARAVRARPGQGRDRQAAAGRGRRGLHRRHGDAPRGRADGRRVVRHRVRRRAHRGDQKAHRRRLVRPRRGHLHLRRRRRGPGRRAQGVRGRAGVHHADLRHDRARRPGSLRAAADPRRHRRPRSRGPPRADLRVRDPLGAARVRPRHAPRAGSPRCSARCRWSRGSSARSCATSTRAASRAG